MQYVIHLHRVILDKLGIFCSLLMLLVVLNVFYDVVARYVFNDVSIALQELEWHLFAAMFMLGIAYTMKEDGHVRVDIFYDNFSFNTQAIINIAGALILALPITLIILYFSWGYTLEAYNMGEGSADPGGLPHRWIIRSVIPVSSLFLLVSISYSILTQLCVLTAPQHKEEQ